MSDLNLPDEVPNEAATQDDADERDPSSPSSSGEPDPPADPRTVPPPPD